MRVAAISILGCGLALLAVGSGASAPAAPTGSFAPKGGTVPFPLVPRGKAPVPASCRRWLTEVTRRPTAMGYRRLAEAYEAARLYQETADAYRREAGLRRKLGDLQAARIVQNQANRWDSRVVLYQEQRVQDEPRRGAVYEPASGCYFGALLVGDERFPNNFSGFNQAAGKQHSVFFDYCHYGQRFPTRWAKAVKAVGGAIQIAFEPNGGLDTVRDDAYLQGFAREAAATRMPIFLRYAAEMNGNWTAYGGEERAQEYIRKWRLVFDVMRRLAPNVAMVWAPNAVPADNFARFYPGDDYVDWVGVNFYAVHHHNNDLSRPADWEDPADQLNVIYSQYAARKPIMICEFAATHFCRADGQSLPGFCTDKMRMLYSALPRRYPRVKAIHWFDLNTMAHRVNAGRDINNYSLTDDPEVFSAYREVISSPYFLCDVQTRDTQASGVRYVPLQPDASLSGTVRLSAWVHTYSDRPVIGYRLDDGEEVALAARPYELEWDTTRVTNGPHQLEVFAFVGGRLAARTRLAVRIAN